ncbi:MAG TPA: hypothetical protein ENN97_01645, partial [Phycisphaerales bacterium]|nr:hypothetical protein [Phycisphaerales bacterium]
MFTVQNDRFVLRDARSQRLKKDKILFNGVIMKWKCIGVCVGAAITVLTGCKTAEIVETPDYER